MSQHWDKDDKNDNKRGLYPKFDIAHADGRPIDPSARYIVLRYDNDPAAQTALLVYAYHIQEKNPQFANELQVEVLGCMDAMDGNKPAAPATVTSIAHPLRHQEAQDIINDASS